MTQKSIQKAKIFALFVSIFILANAAVARTEYSSLKLNLPLYAKHTIVIDNITYQGITNQLSIDNLRSGNHSLKIIQLIFSKRGNIIDKYTLYNGMVFLPKNSDVSAKVSNNGRLFIENTPQSRNDNGCDNHNKYENKHGNNSDCDRNKECDNDCDYHDGNNRNDRNNYDSDCDENDKRDCQENNNNSKRRNGSYDYYASESNNYGGNTNFAMTLSAIKNQAFDSDRLRLAKNIVTQGNCTSSEVAQITSLFSFESSRLEFAKYAYDFAKDKRNYFVVQESLIFSSSKTELQEYITRKGNR